MGAPRRYTRTCAVPAERVNIALRRAMSISFAVTSASRAARRWSAVKRPTDQMNEPSDSEHQSQHAAKDDHRRQRSEKGCRPDTPRHPEPHDQGTHQRHPRVLHPRLGRQPTQRLHRIGWSADDPRGRPQRLSTHGRYFGRGSISLNSLRRGDDVWPPDTGPTVYVALRGSQGRSCRVSGRSYSGVVREYPFAGAVDGLRR